MPTYQYRCSECGQDLEVVQKFSDAALTECPTCQGQLRKVYNAVGVVFKGSGFYSTDNRSGSKKAVSSDSSSKSDSGSSSSGEGSGDSKKESKKESTSTPAPAKAAAS